MLQSVIVAIAFCAIIFYVICLALVFRVCNVTSESEAEQLFVEHGARTYQTVSH